MSTNPQTTDASEKVAIPRLPECITVFISGPVASGKTFLIKRLVDRMTRSLIMDSGADYFGEAYEHVWSNPRQLAERLAKNQHYFRIAYHPSSENYAEEFHWLYASIWTLSLPRWFVVEEVHEVCSINSVHPDFENILRYSRHNLLGIIGSSQRLADVDKLLTSNARMVILFHTSEYRDIEAARLRFGNEVAEAVTNLRPCIYDDASGVCEQHPECLIYIKGYGFRVVSLGSKIKQTEQGEQNVWQEVYQEEPQTPEVQSSPQDSGKKEQELSESTSDHSSQA